MSSSQSCYRVQIIGNALAIRPVFDPAIDHEPCRMELRSARAHGRGQTRRELMAEGRAFSERQTGRTMIDLVKKFFGKSVGNGVAEQAEGRCHNTQVATCAVLLEMAKIDSEFSEEEQESLISILKKRFELSNEDAEKLILASNEELEGSIDLWQFTNLINRNYAIEEKLEIIKTVWEIAYADGKLDKHEDYLLHKLAELLHLTHKQLIDAKLKVLEDRKSP